MSDTPLLALPYLSASQAQKHVTVNEALSLLDGMLHLAVASRAATAPPPAPADGARYLLPAGASGEWAGHAGAVALRMEGAWRFLPPREGWRCWVSDEDKLLVYDGAAWMEQGGGTPQSLPLLGINATADAVNKLAVSSAAVLLNHAGNGTQLKLNKNAAADTASLLFQTGYSGRAEIGTAGDDTLRVKVSTDGTAFTTALAASASGAVTVGRSLLLTPQASDPAAPAEGELWLTTAGAALRCRAGGKTRTLTALGLTCARHLMI